MARTKLSHPKDSYRFIFIVMIWIGITTLLPWNMMVAVHEYWMYKFRDIPEQQSNISIQSDFSHQKPVELNDTQVHWGSYLSISSMVPYIIGLLFTIICGRKVPIIPRLIMSICVIFVLLILTVIFAKINTDSWQGLFLGVTLATIVIMNAAMSLLQGGMGGVAAAFPSNYMNALTQGQAIGGIISCSVNIGLLAAGADHNTAAFICFVLATIFTFICGVLIVLMTKTRFYKYFHPEENFREDPSTEEKMIERTAIHDNDFNEIIFILKKLWPWILATFINFLVTLSIFPTLTSLVSSTVEPQNATEWHIKYFIPIGSFLTYSLGDYFGRFLAGWIQWPNASPMGGYTLLFSSISRIIFIPLFLCCNIQPEKRYYTDVYIESDIAFIFIIILFSLTNGYIGNICLMFGPKTLTVQKEQMKGGEILVAAIIIGLTVGAGLSNFWLGLL